MILDLVRILSRHNVTLISCTEAFDTRTPTGRYLLTLCAARVQLEHETMVQRMADGRMEQARQDGDRGATCRSATNATLVGP
ncbi:MAG: hypothetical protein CYG59_01815 [Chloroflexi bacterium]|nr:MAG: hypothetical protein CYG59_01815 [Chloroflexota bacterium]